MTEEEQDRFVQEYKERIDDCIETTDYLISTGYEPEAAKQAAFYLMERYYMISTHEEGMELDSRHRSKITSCIKDNMSKIRFRSDW